MNTCKFIVESEFDYGTTSCGQPCEGRTDYCGTHNRLIRKAEATASKQSNNLAIKLLKQKSKSSERKAPVKKQSVKQKEALSEYNAERLKWLPGKMCVVFPREIATTVHHAKGRIGYADQWARDHGITLLMDKRYWVPASMEGHRYIEEHPHEAKFRGWSQSRLEIIDNEVRTI